MHIDNVQYSTPSHKKSLLGFPFDSCKIKFDNLDGRLPSLQYIFLSLRVRVHSGPLQELLYCIFIRLSFLVSCFAPMYSLSLFLLRLAQLVVKQLCAMR